MVARVTPDSSWPTSWLESYEYDRQEVYGEVVDRGYFNIYRNRVRHALDLVQSVASPGARVLDLAAAQGNLSLVLAERGYDVTWNDIREDLADYVALKHERGTIRYAPGDAFSLDLGPRFDVVLFTEVIEHVAHPDAFLRHVGQLMRTGGYGVMTTPNGEYFHNKLPRFSECADPSIYEGRQFKPNADGHIFLLYPDEVPELAAAAGLRVRRLRLFTNPLTAGFLKTAPLLSVLPPSLVDGIEWLTERAPGPISRRVNTQMAALLQKS